MSTATLSRQRFADIKFSLVYHATDEIRTGRSMSDLNGRIGRAICCHAFDADPVRDAIKATLFDWQRLNGAAYAVRYAHHAGAAEARDVAPVKYPKGTRLLTVPALLKALRCLHYNCDGGKDSAGSLEKLAKVCDALADYLVEQMPEYQAAGWFESDE